MTAVLGFALRILIFIALYTFLGMAIWAIWKSVSAREPKPGNLAIPMLTLTSDVGGAVKSASFSSAEVLIGRDPECDFVLENLTVSAKHARLSFHQNQWWYEDLRSTNGSFLEDLRIEEPVVVKNDDDVSCGDVAVRINIRPNA
jgi:hypothetical protein